MKSFKFPLNTGGKYHFVTALKLEGRNYKYAIYKDRQGKKYFAKFWHTGLRRGMKRYLTNEINCLKYFSENTTTILKEKFSIAKLVYYEITPNVTFYMVEYIDGKPLSKFKEAKQSETLILALEFMNKFTIGRVEKKIFPSRSFAFYLLSFPYLFLKAVFNYPHKFTLLFKSLIKFYLFIILGGQRKDTLNHRDLNLENIIVKGKVNYLIDFQLAAITAPEFEYASIIRSTVRNYNLTKKLMKKLKKSKLKSVSALNSFKAMLVYYSMMGLIDKKFNIKRTEDFLTVLDLV